MSTGIARGITGDTCKRHNLQVLYVSFNLYNFSSISSISVSQSRVPIIDINEWIGHGYINKIEGSVPEWGREKG